MTSGTTIGGRSVYLPANLEFSYVLPQHFPAAMLGPDASCSAWLCDWTYHACDPVEVVSIKKRKSLITLDLPVGEKYKEVGIKRTGVPFALSGDWARILRLNRDSCLGLVGAVELTEIKSDREKGYDLGFKKGWEVFLGLFAVRIMEGN